MKIFLLTFLLIKLALAQTSLPSDVLVENVCYCVPKDMCLDGSKIIEESDNSLDLRMFRFESPRKKVQSSYVLPSVSPVSTGMKLVVENQRACAQGLVSCCPSTGYSCGMRFVSNISTTADSEDPSAYGAYPWMTALLSSNSDEYLGAGSLIDHMHVITAAHKVLKATNLKVRFGEWSRLSNLEPYPTLEMNIDSDDIFVHPGFTSMRTLKNNIAIIRLESPGIRLGVYPAIAPICLPNQQLENMRCWVAGWGKSDFSGTSGFQQILKEKLLPIIDQDTCQNQLRATRLGGNFVLDRESFICAGGEENVDVCTGDGGSALACQVNNRFYIAGIVAWGIGCGSRNVPGVYVNVFNFIPWIQDTIRRINRDNVSRGFETSATITSTTRVPTTVVNTTLTTSTSRAPNTTLSATTRATTTVVNTTRQPNSTVNNNSTTVTSLTTKSVANVTSTITTRNASTATAVRSGNSTSGNSTVRSGVVANTTSIRNAVTTQTTRNNVNVTTTTTRQATTTRKT